WNGTAWTGLGGAGGIVKVCAENDNCTGTPIFCNAQLAGSDATALGQTIMPIYSSIQFGSWSNTQCGASGTGWSAVSGSCSTGTGSMRARCTWVMVQESGGGGGSAATAAGDGGQVQFNDGSDALAADI